MWHKPLFVSLVLAVTPLTSLTLPAQAKPVSVRPGNLGPRVTLQSYLSQVLGRDRSVTPAELSRVKAQFRTMREKNRVMGLPASAFMRPSFAGPRIPVPEHAGVEREINDSIGYADPLIGSVNGSLDSTGDLDVYEVVMPEDGRLQLSLWSSGANPPGG